MYEIYVAEVCSQSHIYLSRRMNMAPLKSRFSKLHGIPNSAMNLECLRDNKMLSEDVISSMEKGLPLTFDIFQESVANLFP